jgi:hypothetical protein
MMDAVARANGDLLDRWAEAVRKGQAATLKLANAGSRLVESGIPNGRA